MIPLILSLVSAILFLAVAMFIYGLDALAQNAWVALVFWGLVGAGAVVYAVNRPIPDWLCRLQRRIDLVDDLCPGQGACGC